MTKPADATAIINRLAAADFKPRGTLIYLAVADEEAGSIYGASYLTREKFDAVKADYVITESGGVPIPAASGVKLPVTVGEKGVNWRRLVVKGTPGTMKLASKDLLRAVKHHQRQPYRQ